MTFFTLLRAKVLIWKNDLLRMKGRQRLGALVFTVFTIYLTLTILHGEIELFKSLESGFPGASQSFLISTLSGLITFAFFWGIGTMLSQLYLSSDLELLLTAPISPLHIYLLKLLEGMQTLALPGALAVTAWVSYGMAMKSSWSYYLLASIGFICLLALLVAAAMSFIMFVVGLIPARRAQELYVLLWTLIGGGIWAIWMISSNRGGATSLVQRLLTNQPIIAKAGQYLAWSPAGWLARMLTAWQAGQWEGVALNGGLLLVATGILVGLGFFIYQRAFYLGWSRLREISPRNRRANRESKGGILSLDTLLRLLPLPIRAIVAKDWITLPRDIRQLSGLVFPILMALVYIYMTASGEMAKQIPGAASWMALAIVPLIPYFLTLYYTVGTIGIEGKNFALLRLAPLSARQLLWGKFGASLGPTLLIGEIAALIVAILVRAAPLQIVLSIVAMVWFSGGFVAVATGTALLSPNFRATSTRRSAGIATTYATLLINAAFWLASLAVIVYALLRLDTSTFTAILKQLIALAFPESQAYLNSAVVPLAILGAQAVIWAIIVALWKRGIAWVENWEYSALD